MKYSKSRVTAAMIFGAASVSAAPLLHAATPPPPAPAPGSPAIYLSNQQLSEVMKASIAKASEPALSQIASTDQYFINEVHRTKNTGAAVHPGWTEIHIILGGSATFVTGGEIKASGDSKVIEGGVRRRVAKGDVVIVPPNTPHWYTDIDGSLDAIEVRFIAPAAGKAPE
jgi:mannose-6-phosphate isomerase-like protein (cupin superfamily)